MSRPKLTDNPPQRILIVRPSALGDVARTVPALVSLKQHWPEAQIDWLVRDTFVDAVVAHPDLHEAIPFPRSSFRRFGRSLSVTRRVLAYMKSLKNRRYDLVVDLQGLGRSGWLTHATKAPLRVGPADARELAWLGYNQRVAIDPSVRHTVDRMLAVVEALGATPIRDMQLYTTDQDDRWATDALAAAGLEPGRFAAVAPTAAWASKRWPIERFDQVIEQLGDFGLYGAAVVGSPGEESQTRELFAERESKQPRLDLVGKTSVGQMMAILKQAGIVYANDSAALHIAVGLGKRVVSLFGPTDPETVGPYRYATGTVCAEADRPVNYRAQRTDARIIARIGLPEVFDTTRRVLDTPPPPTLWFDHPMETPE
ncbi:MAG: glycosyltransferase family 9 protein [Planctomycetota bacterium]|jgi:lipopolysaccharide heptosyltransferase I